MIFIDRSIAMDVVAIFLDRLHFSRSKQGELLDFVLSTVLNNSILIIPIKTNPFNVKPKTMQ